MIILKIELHRGFVSGYASTEGASDEILAIYGHDLQHIRMTHFTSRHDKVKTFSAKCLENLS